MDRLGDRHEIPTHFGIGDRHRTAGGDLPPEQRDHAAPAAEDVAEPDGGKSGVLMAAVHVLDEQLGNPFGRSHDAGRVNRLVGRNHDESFGPMATGGFRHCFRTEHIVLHRFRRLRFHQRHMLVGCGMEYNLRPKTFEYLADSHGIAHIGNDRRCEQFRIFAPQFLVNFVNAVFTFTEQQESRRRLLGNLPAQFRSNGASRTGDHHTFILHESLHVVLIQMDLLPAQQILQLDSSQLVDRDFAVNQLINPGHGFDGASQGLAQLQGFPQQRTPCRRNGNDDFIHTVSTHQLRQLIPLSQDFRAEHHLIPLGRVVIHESYQFFLILVTLHELPRNHRARIAGPYDEHLVPSC